MKLFTFSGIASSFTETNDGRTMVQFGLDAASAFPPADRPPYTGIPDVEHFRSYINFATLCGELEDAVRFVGSTVLNDEAERLSPGYANTFADGGEADPTEPMLVLAHSQGANNLIFSLKYLQQKRPTFFAKREVRCALFDPKVGRNHVEEVFVLDPEGKISFLFVQSERNLLGNQALFAAKFIDEFPHGNHIWVRGLGHSGIHEWSSYEKPQDWLDLEGYQQFKRDCAKERIRLEQDFGKPFLNTEYMLKWQKYQAKYKMKQSELSKALLGFLNGNLPKSFQS
jgi:hypothetical protein